MHRITPCVLVLLSSGCTQTPLMRNVDATIVVAHVPSTRDTNVSLVLSARPSPPPILPRDQATFEPTHAPSRLDRCRSRFDLCRFERVSVEHALATSGEVTP